MPQGGSPAHLPVQRIWAVVPCGGSGSRAGGDVPKQYRMLADLPVLGHTLVALAQVPNIAGVVLAIAEQDTRFDVVRPGPQEGGFAMVRRAASALVALLSLAGVGAALWQNQVAAKSDSCNLTLADRSVSGAQLDARLAEIFQTRARCADAAVQPLGVPYELWSLALYLLVLFASLAAFGAAKR